MFDFADYVLVSDLLDQDPECVIDSTLCKKVNKVFFIHRELVPLEYKSLLAKCNDLRFKMPMYHFCYLVGVSYQTFANRLINSSYFTVVIYGCVKFLEFKDVRFYERWYANKTIFALTNGDTMIDDCIANTLDNGLGYFKIDDDYYIYY